MSNDRWPDTYLARERHRRHRPLPVRWDLPEEEEEELSEYSPQKHLLGTAPAPEEDTEFGAEGVEVALLSAVLLLLLLAPAAAPAAASSAAEETSAEGRCLRGTAPRTPPPPPLPTSDAASQLAPPPPPPLVLGGTCKVFPLLGLGDLFLPLPPLRVGDRAAALVGEEDVEEAAFCGGLSRVADGERLLLLSLPSASSSSSPPSDADRSFRLLLLLLLQPDGLHLLPFPPDSFPGEGWRVSVLHDSGAISICCRCPPPSLGCCCCWFDEVTLDIRADARRAMPGKESPPLALSPIVVPGWLAGFSSSALEAFSTSK